MHWVRMLGSPFSARLQEPVVSYVPEVDMRIHPRPIVLALLAIVVGCLDGPVAVSRAQGKPPTMDEILFRANEYVVRYQKEFSAVVAEERYHQEAETGSRKETRDLVSDVLLVRGQGEVWSGYRDVFEVDGKAVRDRVERVQKLFLQGPASVRKILDEGARFNLGLIRRNINVPTVALLILDPINQYRFKFDKVGEETLNGTPVWNLRFSEHERPTLIRQGGVDAFSRGSLWIDPQQGRVVKSQMIVGDANSNVRADVTVTYQLDPSVGLWVPTDMVERYDNPRVSNAERITCRATYSRFRRFDVRTGETLQK